MHSLSLLLAPERLHIPDGFLSLPVALAGWLLALLVVGYGLRQTRGQLGSQQIPLMGVLAAFIFAAQAINFPVAGGTSGHLLGGTLAAVVLGPWAGVLVMACVIGVQALLFQDGGLLALGFNIVNMGVLTVFTGHLAYWAARHVAGPGRRSLLVGAGLGAWLSVVLSAAATAVELALSGTSPLAVALPAMVGVHALIGLGEAAITAGALSFLFATRRDLLAIGEAAPARGTAHVVGVGLGLALLVAALSFAASPAPDGLERVAEDQGFATRALEPVFRLLPDYTLPMVSHPVLSGVLAVAAGTLVVFGLTWLLARLHRRRAAAPGGHSEAHASGHHLSA
jgi:cobalt/nickel transport system permease protein